MRYIVFLFLAINFQLAAQTVQNLVTWINMDGPICEIKDEFSDPGVFVFPIGDSLQCVCGAIGNARYFNGVDAQIALTGSSIKSTFTTVDFTLSFYFKPDKKTSPSGPSQTLFSYSNGCNTDSSFIVKYDPGVNRFLSVDLTENASRSASLIASLPFSCWNHIAIVRRGPEVILYHNGKELKRASTFDGQRIPFSSFNIGGLFVGGSDCNTSEKFNGIIDEIRLYKRALTREQVEDLYVFPDNISTGGLRLNDDLKDTTIFLGESVQINLTNTCVDDFEWMPAAGVIDVNEPEPVIKPDLTTTYILTMSDTFGCDQVDSLRIVVSDPANMKCGDIFFPTAFTPNGDNLNDEFGISNPFTTGTILAFDIFDRWGNIVFSTVNPLEKWDGSFRGTPVNPGVFLYRLRFRCDDMEDLISGSVTVIR